MTVNIVSSTLPEPFAFMIHMLVVLLVDGLSLPSSFPNVAKAIFVPSGDQTHLWFREYDQVGTNSLSVQTEVTQAVARELAVILAPLQSPPRPEAREPRSFISKDDSIGTNVQWRGLPKQLITSRKRSQKIQLCAGVCGAGRLLSASNVL